MIYEKGNFFPEEELEMLRGQFDYVDCDYRGTKRLFFDNAGGSLRLKAAADAFDRVNRSPDASEHSNQVALELAEVENAARKAIKEVVFNAKQGAIYPSYTASGITMEMVRIISEHAMGSNYVTTMLEHPSAYDAMEYYAKKNNCEFRVAGANEETGGIDAESVLSLVDENTAVLCCMAASNISGYILDIHKIATEARKINPEIYILCDAVQHAPHGALDPEASGIDVMDFAPYKFFGVRGFGLAYVSDRVAKFDHNRLNGKALDDWEIGSPSTPQFAATLEIIQYVQRIGAAVLPEETDGRRLYEMGMKRIADHERALLHLLLEGTDTVPGLRHLPGITVKMDCKDLLKRDLIMGIEFDAMDCSEAVKELEKHNVVAFERRGDSLYSRRMVESFHSKGVVRISPLHVNIPEEMLLFLETVQDMT